ncbi:MAG TPA: MFS transporter [Pyrinomonadaceae bacterium]|jgi:MFS family permease
MSSNIAPANSTSKLPAVFRAFKHRNFQLFFGGQIVSLTGTWMQSVAQSWLVYRLTGSVALLGLIGFAGQFPVFLLTSFGGAIADKYNRQRILVTTQTCSMILASILAALGLTGTIAVWHIFVLASLGGVINAFDIPTRQSFVVDMVGKDDLLNAIALNSSMFNGARIIGPAVAGILVSAVGEGWCFFGNAVSYIAVITGLLSMRLARKQIVASEGSAIEKIKEGFRFVIKTAPVRALLLLLGLVSLMGMPYAVLMPIFAEEILHGGVRGLGILMGASGSGALVAALFLASRKSIKGLGRLVAISSGTFGAFLILFSFSRSFWLSAALLAPAGFSMMLQMSSSNTLVQSMVPDELRGRVMAVYSMMFMGMAPLGALMAGSLAGILGAPATVALGGAVCIVGSILFSLRLPKLRHEAREIIVALQMTGGEPASKASFQQPALVTSKK